MPLTTTLIDLSRLTQNPDFPTGLYAGVLGTLRKTWSVDEPIPLTHILDMRGVESAVWALHALNHEALPLRSIALELIQGVKHLLKHPCVVDAYYVARRYANDNATDNELDRAREAAFKAETTGTDAAVRYAASRGNYGTLPTTHRVKPDALHPATLMAVIDALGYEKTRSKWLPPQLPEWLEKELRQFFDAHDNPESTACP